MTQSPRDVPQVSSPLTTALEVVGSKEIPISSEVIMPELKRLSVTVGISVLGSLVKVPAEASQPNVWMLRGCDVPCVRSTGPILCSIVSWGLYLVE